jgi:hypothetical protein
LHSEAVKCILSADRDLETEVLAKPSPAAWHPHFRICTCDVRVGIANLTYLRGCLFDRRWNNFLVGEAGAAGALTGRMFVAVSIDWPRVLLSKRSRSCWRVYHAAVWRSSSYVQSRSSRDNHRIFWASNELLSWPDRSPGAPPFQPTWQPWWWLGSLCSKTHLLRYPSELPACRF